MGETLEIALPPSSLPACFFSSWVKRPTNIFPSPLPELTPPFPGRRRAAAAAAASPMISGWDPPKLEDTSVLLLPL